MDDKFKRFSDFPLQLFPNIFSNVLFNWETKSYCSLTNKSAFIFPKIAFQVFTLLLAVNYFLWMLREFIDIENASFIILHLLRDFLRSQRMEGYKEDKISFRHGSGEGLITTWKLLHLLCTSLPSATPVSKALPTLLLCNAWLSFLTCFISILLWWTTGTDSIKDSDWDAFVPSTRENSPLPYKGFISTRVIIPAYPTENKYSSSERSRKSSQGGFEKQVGEYTKGPELQFMNAARASAEDLPSASCVFGIIGFPEAASYQTKKKHSTECSLLPYPYRDEGKLKLRSANTNKVIIWSNKRLISQPLFAVQHFLPDILKSIKAGSWHSFYTFYE